MRPFYAQQSVSVTCWARPTCVTKVSNASRADLFLLFIGKGLKRANQYGFVLESSNSKKKKKVLFKWILKERRSKRRLQMETLMLHLLYVFGPVFIFASGPALFFFFFFFFFLTQIGIQAAEHWADRGPRSTYSSGRTQRSSSARLHFAYRIVVGPMATAVMNPLMTSSCRWLPDEDVSIYFSFPFLSPSRVKPEKEKGGGG